MVGLKGEPMKKIAVITKDFDSFIDVIYDYSEDLFNIKVNYLNFIKKLNSAVHPEISFILVNSDSNIEGFNFTGVLVDPSYNMDNSLYNSVKRRVK